MKILILDNLLNNYSIYYSKHQYKLYNYYTKLKLESYLKRIMKKYKNNELKIKIVSQRDEIFPFKENNIEFELFSDFRIRMDRQKFKKIEMRIIKNVKNLLFNFIKNTLNLKTIHLKGLYLSKLIEYDLIGYFNRIFGEFEIFKEIMNDDDYDKIIFINFNPNFFFLLKNIFIKFNNIELLCDKFLAYKLYFNKIPKIKHFINFIYLAIQFWFKDLFKQHKSNDLSKKNLLINVQTNNQYKSIYPVFKYFKNKTDINAYFFSFENNIPRGKTTNLLKFIILLRRIWSKNQIQIYKGMHYEALRVNNILEEFFKSLFFFDMIIYIYNLYHHINNYLDKNPISLVIVSDILRFYSRIALKIFKKKGILSLYIPHAAVSSDEEVITNTGVDFIMVPGEIDKENYIKRGEDSKKIFITGRPRYNFVYKETINKLKEVRDIFDNRIYKFKPEKITILLTTNPIDDKSNEIIIKSVIDSLKDLDLIDNLIIKLHPSESGHLHRKILQKLNVNPIIIKDYNIFEVIRSCDLLLSRISTTILESMIIGVPSIALDLNNEDPFFLIGGTYQFMKDPFLLKAIDSKSLTNYLKKIIFDKDFLKKYSQDLREASKKYSFLDDKLSPLKKTIKIIKILLEDDIKTLNDNRSF